MHVQAPEVVYAVCGHRFNLLTWRRRRDPSDQVVWPPDLTWHERAITCPHCRHWIAEVRELTRRVAERAAAPRHAGPGVSGEMVRAGKVAVGASADESWVFGGRTAPAVRAWPEGRPDHSPLTFAATCGFCNGVWEAWEVPGRTPSADRVVYRHLTSPDGVQTGEVAVRAIDRWQFEREFRGDHGRAIVRWGRVEHGVRERRG